MGEDGPTHQPVEHEMQIRLLEHLHNHRGERSMVVLRPADATEAIASWKIALEEERPVGLIFSRQNVDDVPAMGESRFDEAMVGAKRGGYVVADCEGTPDVVMVASGSEVSTLIAGAAKLNEEGIKTRIVSAPSEALFFDQPAEYRNEVLPEGIVRYGLTSGLPMTLQALVGLSGKIHGLDHFGYSAPFKVLDEKFGFSGETVYKEVKEMLGR